MVLELTLSGALWALAMPVITAPSPGCGIPIAPAYADDQAAGVFKATSKPVCTGPHACTWSPGLITATLRGTDAQIACAQAAADDARVVEAGQRVKKKGMTRTRPATGPRCLLRVKGGTCAQFQTQESMPPKVAAQHMASFSAPDSFVMCWSDQAHSSPLESDPAHATMTTRDWVSGLSCTATSCTGTSCRAGQACQARVWPLTLCSVFDIVQRPQNPQPPLGEPVQFRLTGVHVP